MLFAAPFVLACCRSGDPEARARFVDLMRRSQPLLDEIRPDTTAEETRERLEKILRWMEDAAKLKGYPAERQARIDSHFRRDLPVLRSVLAETGPAAADRFRQACIDCHVAAK